MSDQRNTEIQLSISARSDRKQWWLIIWAVASAIFFWIDTRTLSANLPAEVHLLKYFCALAVLAIGVSVLLRSLDKYSLLEIGNVGIRMRIRRVPLLSNTNHEIFIPWAALAEVSFHKSKIDELVFHLKSETPAQFGFSEFELRPSPWPRLRTQRNVEEKSQATVIVSCFEIRPREILPLMERQIEKTKPQKEVSSCEDLIGDQWQTTRT